MKTKKEYGLIFEDLSVKVAEVVVDRDYFECFCVAGLLEELRKELDSFLEKNQYHPLAVIPDTALYGGFFTETAIRGASKAEAGLYLLDYEDGKGEYTS